MPLILHATWLRSDPQVPQGQLFHWAENQESDAAAHSRDSRLAATHAGRSRAAKVPSHPLQAPVSQLRQMLVEQMPALERADLIPASASVWAPTRAGAPVLQRTLLTVAAEGEDRRTHEAAARAPIELAPWQVTGLALSPVAALACLAHLNNGAGEKSSATATIYHRLRLGKDLLYWSHVAKFALELLINQHYLPALHAHANGYFVAAWQPFVSDPRLQERFDHLVLMMPPVCRSYNLAGLEAAPSSGQLVEHFVATVMDATIRQWGSAGLGSAELDKISPANRAAYGANDFAAAAHAHANGAATGAPSGIAAGSPSGSPSGAPAQWFAQLLNGRRTLNLPPQQAYQFYQQWQSWTEQLQYTTETTFRVCFRLEEPPATTRTGEKRAPLWTLGYLLQARDNPDWRIPARDVWNAQTGSIRIGNRRVDQPQERLRAGLATAARIFDPIARSLRSPSPEDLLLTTDEAYRFLREAGPVLESSGFGVLLPDWWHTERRTGLGLRMRLSADEENAARDTGHNRLDGGLNARVRFEWELTLGGRSLARDEFEQMAAMRTPLLRQEDRWIELDPQQVAAAQRFIVERKATGVLSLLQTVRVVQSFNRAEEGALQSADASSLLPTDLLKSMPAILPVDSMDVSGWLGDVIERLKDQQASAVVREPVGFVGKLRPYQRRGVGWLSYLRQLGLGACLADDMGLGKTVQAIALLLHVRATENGTGEKVEHQPALLICPTSVVANWRREVERFAPGLRVLVHHGGGRLTDEAFARAVAEHDIVITSYGTARRDIDALVRWRWSDLILDEAQNIKNPTAKQTQAVRSLDALNRIALTGTPVENRLSELWSIVEFLNAGYLESHERFRQQYIVPIERYNDDESAAELRRLVQPFLLRRVKSDPSIISDLPEKNEMIVYCSLTSEQAALYEAVVRETLEELDRSEGMQRRGLVLGLITRLKQIANHPAHFRKEAGPLVGRSGKLERLTEMLEEALAVGDHALVFTQFVEMGTLLQRHLRDTFGVEALFLHGGTPATQRDQMVQAFQEEDGPPIFILSLRAGGAGLNLTRASHVFHYDRWWNPAVENQATDRAFRIGQRRNVQVHKFVVAGTLEERIHAIVEGKQNLADNIVGSGEQWLTELSTDQLRDLLTLRREMVDDL